MKHILYILLVSPLVFSLDTIDNCDDIELFFKSPQDGLIIENQKFKVEFGTKNINISPAGVIVEQTNNCLVSGHHHLIINDAYDVRNFENQPIPYDTNILHFGGGQKEAELTHFNQVNIHCNWLLGIINICLLVELDQAKNIILLFQK